MKLCFVLVTAVLAIVSFASLNELLVTLVGRRAEHIDTGHVNPWTVGFLIVSNCLKLPNSTLTSFDFTAAPRPQP